MTQEEKQLLLKDLCARLPYGVKMTDGVDTYRLISPFLYKYIEMELKPYLRPMFSMTKEEKLEYDKISGQVKTFYGREAESMECSNLIDWLNAHHFDYRIIPSTGKSMIESGLALEAKEEMYE